MRVSPPTIEEFAFHVELWSHDDLRVDDTLAVAKNIRVARAAYDEALKGQEGRIVKLRHGARVILP
ncbi:hypothetical protein [Mesorhizobium sp. M7A.F.Ca.MR.362.00.0.0]|uniref:hypothetical protein n=1 Tax=Mesorhizobium sp. M7A.F.Ca.MR.362.00.0.0 TaxID=2496779 RepID=UPI000FD52890|nr:hypothetical protein [Mesorhizobium sp. M7A.F.Ca.MR.362.00.0.0]RUU78219.1 hypothetical protein EOC06_20605 [Mesorhizobium sp. M7A.F.Ca.MR.362.00.0.0]RWN95409.1 MAG: hypothetical protein EOS05_11490 [Mesorhizobium sp.]